MKNEILYGLGGLALGVGGLYLAISQGWIPSPAPAPVVAISPMRARAPQPVANTLSQYGKFGRASYNGNVVATNIPTQHARAGILARPQSQVFEAPMHADLIRVD